MTFALVQLGTSATQGVVAQLWAMDSLQDGMAEGSFLEGVHFKSNDFRPLSNGRKVWEDTCALFPRPSVNFPLVQPLVS